MRIACPACAAAYEVPDRLLAGAPRMLRCARCGASFALPRLESPAPAPAEPPPEPEVAAAPPVESPPPAVAVTEPDPPPEVPAPDVAVPPEHLAPEPLARRDEPPPRALVGAWAASIAAVVLGALSLLIFRATVMEAWPPSTRLFAALGLS